MQTSGRFIRSLLTSSAWWLGVCASLALSLLADEMIARKARAEFDSQARHAQSAIEARVQSYVDVLHGAGALFYTGDNITRTQFHSYVERLNLDSSFPGMVNLNFARRVTAQEKQAFLAAVMAEDSASDKGHPDFAIRPAGERSEYHVLTFLEPMEEGPDALGQDIAAQPMVAGALALSRDTGQPILSESRPAAGGPPHHVTLTIRMPLYRRGMPVGTVAERQAAYYGSVGAGFDIEMLMQRLMGGGIPRHLGLRLFDAGASNGPGASGTTALERLLFDSTAMRVESASDAQPQQTTGMLRKRTSMTVGSRIWEIEFAASRKAMLSAVDAILPGLVLATGLLASLLFYCIYFSLILARRHATEMANHMTKDLRESEDSLAQAQHMAHLGSWVLEPASGKMSWSEETYRILGLSRFEAPDYGDLLRHVHEEDRQWVRESLEQSICNGEELDVEHRIAPVEGVVRWVQTIARLRIDDGQVRLRGIMMDITERKHTLEALKRSQELLRDLTAYQDRVKEEERKRIAREIHDELGQTLLALRIDVSLLDARTAHTHPRLNEKVRSALNQIDATVKTVRTIINNLRPAVLDLGLTAAIEWQVKEFRRRSGIHCELIMGAREFSVDDARATTLFRVLQESLTNVIRHARASRVIIQLYQEADRLIMKISDDGVGIDWSHRKMHNAFGLVGVEERILALNGDFLIDSMPGSGTVLTILIPMETSEDIACRQIA